MSLAIRETCACGAEITAASQYPSHSNPDPPLNPLGLPAACRIEGIAATS